MNTEIVRELARQWRRNSKPEPMNAVLDEVMPAEDCPRDLRKMLQEEIQQAIFAQCAQDLEDVIRIYSEFKYKK